MVLHNTLGHCYFPPDTSALVAEFNQETLILASDGSVLHNDATQVWVLYSQVLSHEHTDMGWYLVQDNYLLLFVQKLGAL